MQSLIEKYKAKQKIKETKAFEEWKKTQSKSAVKTGLFSSLFMTVGFTLYRVLDKYFDNKSYLWNDFKNDFIFLLIVSLFVGASIAWSINRKYQRKLNEETINGNKLHS